MLPQTRYTSSAWTGYATAELQYCSVRHELFSRWYNIQVLAFHEPRCCQTYANIICH